MDAAQVADLFIVSQVRVDVDAGAEGGCSPCQRCQVRPLLEPLPPWAATASTLTCAPRCAPWSKSLPVIE